MSRNGEINAVIGLQFGDEGKGRTVDQWASTAHIVARGTGANNAGHAVQLPNGEEIDLHLIPSGVVHPVMNVIGGNTQVNPIDLFTDEIAKLEKAGIGISPDNLMLASQAHLIFPAHVEADKGREAKTDQKQGSTSKGVAFVNAEKALRTGVQAGRLIGMAWGDIVDMALEHRKNMATMFGLSKDKSHRTRALKEAKKFADYARMLVPFIGDTVAYLNEACDDGKRILLEGAQAIGLDVNFGEYPKSTSYATGPSAILDGVGLGGRSIDEKIGVIKLIPSRVGGGSVVTRIKDPTLEERLRGEPGAIDRESGKSTGRDRTLGYLDLAWLRRAVMLSHPDQLVLTKADKMREYGNKTLVCVGYNYVSPMGGKRQLDVAPTSYEDLIRCEPIYRSFRTWKDCGSKAAEAYYRFIEDELGVPVTMVGTGPGRNDFIRRHAD